MADSPQASAAMVAAIILNQGGAAPGWKSKCKKIYAEFDPPIITGSYSSVSRKRQQANKAARERGEPEPYGSYQSEHMVPNGCCTQGAGRDGPPVPGLPGYSEGTGFSYGAYDDQIKGTEHKFLTDRARELSGEFAAAGSQGTVAQWLDAGEQNAADMLEDDLKRREGEAPRPRVSDHKNRTPAERKKLAQAAARCLRLEAEQHFKKRNRQSGDPKLNNGFHKQSAPGSSGGTQGGGGIS